MRRGFGSRACRGYGYYSGSIGSNGAGKSFCFPGRSRAAADGSGR